MATETQTDFSGGLNTRLPAHRIAENQSTELTNVDLSHGDLRGEYGINGEGFSDYYYEEADQWVSGDGFSPTVTVVAWTSPGGGATSTISSSINYFSPGEITDTATVIIGDGATVEFFEDSKGVYGANSFVEYNDDLYISRTQFSVKASFATGTPANIKDINFGSDGDAYKVQVGDLVSGTGIVTDSVIISVDTGNNKAIINNAVTATVSLPGAADPTNVTIKPIISRFLDGTTTQGYRASARQPNPLITFSQSASYSGSQSDRDASTDPSKAWFSSSYPIPFQYGLAHFDQTGLESSMSPMTDSRLSPTYFDTAKNNIPVNVSLSDGISRLDRATSSDNTKGRYALYRVGGSSAFTKRVANLFLDSSLQIATTESTNNLQVALTGATDTHQYRVEWFCYNSGTTYSWTYADNETLSATKTGITDWYNTSSGAKTFTLTGSGTTHKADIFVWVRVPGEKVEREYICRALTHNDANVANASTYDYVDFSKSDALIDIEPIGVPNVPKRGLKYLAESGNLFFAAEETHLYVSDYGNPNSWRESSLIDFDQKITALAPMGLEMIVFTEYGMFKIYGSDPENLKRVQIPTTEGVPDGADKCVAKFQQGIMFASHNGICFYNGQTVQRLTQNILNTWALPDSTASNNCGGFYEDVYYLLGATGSGYKLDIRSSPMKLSRTSMNATNLFYRGAVNTLYAPTGRVNYPEGSRTTFSATTRKFTGGDINMEKVFYNVKLSAINFSGTINILIDGIKTDTFTVSTSVDDYDRTLYLSSPRIGNGIQVQLKDCYGEVHRISVNYDATNTITDRMFNSVQVQYTGTPTVQVFLDGISKISRTLTTPDDIVGEAKLYFPPMSNGIIVHFKETTDESNGRVLNYSYQAEAV